MKRSFSVPLRPMSVNSTYYGNKKFGMTTEAKEWTYKFFHAVSVPETRQKLKELREYFDPKKHSYRIELCFNIPREKFFNKQGLISSRTADLSNVEKIYLDCLMLPKHFGTNVPYQCEQLNIDDKYVTEMSSRKVAVDADYSIDVTIEII